MSGGALEGAPATGSRGLALHLYLWPSLLLASAACWWAAELARRFEGRFDRLQIFYYQFITHELSGSILTIGLLVTAALLGRWVRPDWVDGAVQAIGERPLLAAAVTTVALAVAAPLAYHAHPLSMDEYSVVFQAKVFAAGELAGILPPELLPRLMPQFFRDEFFLVSSSTGLVVQSYWPGFSLLLVPFEIAGVPWLLNPLLAGGSLLLVGRVARKLFGDPRAAGWAVILTVASPAFVLNAISFYTMTAHLFFNLAFVALLLDPTPRRLFWGGLVGSLALTVQHPVPHVLFAVPWLVYFGTRRGGVRNLAWLGLGYLPLSLLLGVGWLIVRVGIRDAGDAASLGSALQQPLELAQRVFSLPDQGFLAVRAMGVLKLFLWGAPGLLVLAALGAVALRKAPFPRLLVWSAASVFIGFLFVPLSQGHGWGFRFFHYCWFALPLLAAGYLTAPGAGRARLTSVVGVATLLGLLAGNGLRLHQAETFIASQLAQVPRVAAGRSIVFLGPRDGYYMADLVQNDPFLRDPQTRLLSFGRVEDARLVAALFPHARKVFERGDTTVWEIDRP
jgi:hypothetical protein